jgi:hypothetical protein
MVGYLAGDLVDWMVEKLVHRSYIIEEFLLKIKFD